MLVLISDMVFNNYLFAVYVLQAHLLTVLAARVVLQSTSCRYESLLTIELGQLFAHVLLKLQLLFPLAQLHEIPLDRQPSTLLRTVGAPTRRVHCFANHADCADCTGIAGANRSSASFGPSCFCNSELASRRQRKDWR